MASPFIELEVGERLVKVTNPDKVLFPGRRSHEARPRRLLPLGRRGHRARAARAADAAAPLPGRDRGRADLPEARAGEAPRVDRGGARHLPLRPPRRRALRHRARPGRLGREPRRDRLPSRGRRAAPTPSIPDELRIDIDPQPGTDFGDGKAVAAIVREMLAEIGYTGWPKTSGNRGIHIACRIEPQWEFPVVRRCALAFAREIERRAPELVTTAWWKEERGEKVFIDYNQNARDRTIASAYSVRAAARRGRVGAGHLGRAARRRDRGLHARLDAAALRDARRRAGGDRRHRLRPAGAARVGRARRGRRGRRGAVPAELPQDAGRAAARAAVAGAAKRGRWSSRTAG